MNQNLLRNLFKTTPDYAIMFLRIVLAIVMFAHGAQKMIGWFGGHGPLWTVEMWEKWFGFPAFVTWLVIVGEFAGSILLLIGLLTRLMAAVTTLIMIGAVYFVHLKWGFFMNWYSEQGRGEGIEIHILIVGICILLIVRGGGSWSVDGRLTNLSQLK